MKLYIPFDKWFITQHMGRVSDYYTSAGWKGHTGTDIVATGTDKTIYASTDGYIYSTINRDNPNLNAYRAVYQLVDDNGIFYEVSYGHCSAMYISENVEVKRGTALARQGNTGNVFSGGVEVTTEQKRNNPDLGAHLHLQVRLVKPVTEKKSGKKYLENINGSLKRSGYYFEVQNYDNGYAGCIDAEQFFVYETAKPKSFLSSIIPTSPQITKTLKYGSRGDEVKLLQAKLGGLTVDGIFGIKTDTAVRAFQAKHGLVVDGIVGKYTTIELYK